MHILLLGLLNQDLIFNRKTLSEVYLFFFNDNREENFFENSVNSVDRNEKNITSD